METIAWVMACLVVFACIVFGFLKYRREEQLHQLELTRLASDPLPQVAAANYVVEMMRTQVASMETSLQRVPELERLVFDLRQELGDVREELRKALLKIEAAGL